MAKKKRTISHLVCEDCRERNYSQVVSGGRSVGALKIKKFCNRCRAHKEHKESK
jgi:large subunit ribosomal protein L33